MHGPAPRLARQRHGPTASAPTKCEGRAMNRKQTSPLRARGSPEHTWPACSLGARTARRTTGGDGAGVASAALLGKHCHRRPNRLRRRGRGRCRRRRRRHMERRKAGFEAGKGREVGARVVPEGFAVAPTCEETGVPTIGASALDATASGPGGFPSSTSSRNSSASAHPPPYRTNRYNRRLRARRS